MIDKFTQDLIDTHKRQIKAVIAAAHRDFEKAMEKHLLIKPRSSSVVAPTLADLQALVAADEVVYAAKCTVHLAANATLVAAVDAERSASDDADTALMQLQADTLLLQAKIVEGLPANAPPMGA